jgi:uncharacterized protein (TIRG00374 family)
MDTVETPPGRTKIPKWLLPVFGYSLAAASLIWVFSQFPFAKLGEHLRTLNWGWIALAVVVEIGVYFIDAWRWMVILGPAGAPPFVTCVQAVFVGLFANDILPARAGEVIRCFLLSFKTEVPISLALTSDLIERIMDGIWIVLIYMLVTRQIATHDEVNHAMWVFGGSVSVIALVILFILFHKKHAHSFMSGSRFGRRFIHLLDEIHRLGHWRELGATMSISGLYWLAQIFVIWAIARADAFDFGFGQMAFLLVVKTVGTLIPNAPANLGVFQATIIYALTKLYTERPEAAILAEIIFTVLTLPLLIGGAIAIFFAGFNLTDLHRHAHAAHNSRKTKPEETP